MEEIDSATTSTEPAPSDKPTPPMTPSRPMGKRTGLMHNMELEGEAVPLRCSEDRLSDGGAVLLENGHALFLWLGQACPPELIQGLFNLPSLAHLQPNNARRLPSPSN
ncbi:unnamed protein product [Boreogadus saida]